MEPLWLYDLYVGRPRVRIFLGLCQKEGTTDAVTLAHCFFRWQRFAQKCHHSADFDKEADHYEGSAPSKPTMPAKRKAKKMKR